jgi:hypothetical protein
LLRFVLEGEGFDVVGEADRSADLVHVVALLKPDVVVLDDGIGVAAVGMVREVAPRAKVILVWPQAVVPIGGDARVEPAHVVQELGPAVERVAATLIGDTTESRRRPDWIDRVRKDPTALRELLSASGARAGAGLDVPQLQRRIADAQRRERERVGATTPIGAGAAPTEPPQGAVAPVVLPAPGEADEGEGERARRLGIVALGAAAASAALVFALSLGGSRIPVLVLGERPSAPTSPSPPPVISPSPPGGETTGGDDGGERRGRDGGQDEQVYAPVPAGPTVGPGGTTGGDGGEPGGGGPGGGPGGDDGDGTGGTDGGGLQQALPGRSALHNPYGGPPGILGFTPRPWMFLDGEPGFAGEHGLALGLDRTADADRVPDRRVRQPRSRAASASVPAERSTDGSHPSGHRSSGAAGAGGRARGPAPERDRPQPSGPGHASPPAHAGHASPPAHAGHAHEPGPAHAHKR